MSKNWCTNFYLTLVDIDRVTISFYYYKKINSIKSFWWKCVQFVWNEKFWHENGLYSKSPVTGLVTFYYNLQVSQ